MKYELFFFKENNRYIDVDELVRFFSFSPYIKQEINKDSVLFVYNNEDIKLSATFALTQASRVKDVYRLNPRYLDLDFSLQIDPLLPTIKLNIILDIVSQLCSRFNFYVYNYLFEDVAAYRKELIVDSYELYREKYREKFPAEYLSLAFVVKDKVNDIYKYLYERNELTKYYEQEQLYFPNVMFLKGNSNGRIYCGVELEFDIHFVFPPRTDLVFYNDNNISKIVYCDELLSVIDKYTYELAGFGHNTKVLDKNGIKKLRKILAKSDFSKVFETFEEIDKDQIIDFK